MSGGIFVVALVVVAFTVIIACVMDSYGQERCVVPTIVAGGILTVALMALSFSFVNMKHLAASLKYDHVVVLDVEHSDYKDIDVDESKIIYRNDYTSGPRGYRYVSVILAWNDDCNNVDAAYKKAVSAASREKLLKLISKTDGITENESRKTFSYKEFLNASYKELKKA